MLAGRKRAVFRPFTVVKEAVNREAQAVAAEPVLMKMGQEIGSNQMNLAIAALAVSDQERESSVRVQPEGQH